ncbi:MAG: zinc ribbon domain-containing protein [Bacilli bacterium]|nr:zinc ribbon domain-containing protein [Bacilli bacterium]
MFEGTGLYFELLFLVLFIVYITVKICLANLFKKAKEQPIKAFVPFYNKLVLVKLLNLKMKVFYFTLIPFVNLYYFYIIIKELLKAFGMSEDEAVWYLVIPMYKFPELVFRNLKFLPNEYELTEEFLATQNALSKQPKVEELTFPESSGNAVTGQTEVEPYLFEQNIQMVDPNNQDSVFTNQSLEPDKRQVTYVEAHDEEKKEQAPIITPLDDRKQQVCPKCGTRLAPSADVCFFCGTKLN